MLLPLAACGEREGVVSYEVSAPAAYDWPEAEAFEDGAEGFVWEVPAGFVPSPDVPESLLGDYRAAGSDEALPLRLTVSTLPGDGGGMPANVQRWMGQLMFRVPADPTELVTVSPALPHPAGGVVWNVRVRGQFSNPNVPTAMRAAIVTVLDPAGRPVVTWFVKLTGDEPALQRAMDGFTGLVYSLRREGTPKPDLDAAMPPGDDPHRGVPGLAPVTPPRDSADPEFAPPLAPGEVSP